MEKGSGVFIPTNYVSTPPLSFVLELVNEHESPGRSLAGEWPGVTKTAASMPK